MLIDFQAKTATQRYHHWSCQNEAIVWCSGSYGWRVSCAWQDAWSL